VEPVNAVAQQRREFGVEALVVQGNVSKDENCRRLAPSALKKWGRVDALINNAGTTNFVGHNDLEGLSADHSPVIYAVNVVGPYQMTLAVTPTMKMAGHVAAVNIASIAGVLGSGSSVAYAASKGALNTMTLSLARALAACRT
jgi:3-oxoacyl-[acyl-carrier protein] reductase